MGGMRIIYTENTDSLMRLALVDLKSPQPHSQHFQGGSNASVQVFLDREVEYVVGSENVQKDDNNPNGLVVLYDYLELLTGDENKYKDIHGKDVPI